MVPSPGMDWNAIGAFAALGMNALLIAGGLIGYGRLQSQVTTLRESQKEDRERMDRMETAIKEAASVGSKVELLSVETKASHKMLELAQDASAKLLNQKMDGVLGEVRSFVAGQAAAGMARSARRQPS